MAENGAKKSPRLSDGIWAGEPCFIIGGGPSLRGFDWSLLADRKNIIAINRAMKDAPHAPVMISEDERFFRRFAGEPWYRSFKGEKIYSCPDDSYVQGVREVDPSVRIVGARSKAGGWSRSLADGLSTSSNSAIPALNLADILGADPIYLLGIDCKADGARLSNYHDSYPRDWDVGTAQLESYRSDFEHWVAPNLRHRTVVSLNEHTTLGCWPRIDPSGFFR